MAKRDNFSEKIKGILARRVGYYCSNPECRCPTAGPAVDETKSIHWGEAAHITAAALGGPRYEPSLTTEERKSLANGIWLCSNCARKIDKDQARYTRGLLIKWKKDAEAFSFQARATSGTKLPNLKIDIHLDESDKKFLQTLGLAQEENIESTLNKMWLSAHNDIEKFRNERTLPAYTTYLNLTLENSQNHVPITLEDIANNILVADRINLVSPPGMGKTITLIQLTEHILNTKQAIPVLINLPEWTDFSNTFFEHLAKRNSFREYHSAHFMQLAYYGRLILILDGFNEIDYKSRIATENHILTLKRDFPQLIIVMGSRPQANIPNANIILKIEPLSEEQQIDLANKLAGEKNTALLEKAQQIPNLRELITIPLYFNALINSAPSNILPQTKDDILNLFIKQHEKRYDRAEILRNKLQNFQDIILSDLAAQATETMRTTLLIDDARSIIAQTMKNLQNNGQITSLLQPNDVIDVLVDIHSLIRSSTGADSITFQHQQIQEWYASIRVEKFMVEASQGNTQARNILKKDILNCVFWEESILFACERLSRKDATGTQAVANTILITLGIDPILAAKMIYCSSTTVWSYISNKIIHFVKIWHKAGEIDRAIRFMITSGCPEFSEYIWPLISTNDDQIYLKALYTARPFRPTVLGSNVKTRLTELPVHIRSKVISEIGRLSDLDGIELAADLAKTDNNTEVVVEILETLYFRRANRYVKNILQTASNHVWKLIAKNNYIINLTDNLQNKRLRKMKKNINKQETDPIKLIIYLSEVETNIDIAKKRIAELIKSSEFPIKDACILRILEKSFKHYPEVVVNALLERISIGLEIPIGSEEYIKNFPAIDEGPIANATLNGIGCKIALRAAYTVIGPVTIGHMMDKLFVQNENFRLNKKRLDKKETDECQRLIGGILLSRQTSFFTAFFQRSESTNLHQLEIMTDLLARHNKYFEPLPFIIDEDISSQLVNILKKWTNLGLSESSTSLLLNITRIIERLPKSDFIVDLKNMLKHDLDKEDKVKNFTISRSYINNNVTARYHKSFVAIGNYEITELMKTHLSNQSFGITAAAVLRDIWLSNNISDNNSDSIPLNGFSQVKKNYIQLHQSQQPPPTCDFAEEIFNIVRKLGTPDNDSFSQIHAIELSSIALSIPHGIKNFELQALYKLPQKSCFKLNLLTMAAKAGEIIPSHILHLGLQELLTDAQAVTWLLNENSNELMSWIELFAFSDQPIAVIEALNIVPDQYKQPWQMDRLLTALGNSPHEQALETLQSLARLNPQYTKQSAWLNAFFELNTDLSAYALLDLISEGKIFEDNNNIGIFNLPKKLAFLVRKFPFLLKEIEKRYINSTYQVSKELLEYTLFEIPDTSVILTLIDDYAKNGKPYHYGFSSLIRKLAIKQQPLVDWPDAFEQISVPLNDLRQKLFCMLDKNDAQSSLAEACLIEVEELRDEYGRIYEEPRHPNIDVDRPWPDISL